MNNYNFNAPNGQKRFIIKINKRIILPIVCFISNVFYCFIGWYILILYLITAPDSDKFPTDSCLRNIIFPILLLCHLVGELLIIKKYCKKFFKNKKAKILLIIVITLIYIFPLWVDIVEDIIG